MTMKVYIPSANLMAGMRERTYGNAVSAAALARAQRRLRAARALPDERVLRRLVALPADFQLYHFSTASRQFRIYTVTEAELSIVRRCRVERGFGSRSIRKVSSPAPSRGAHR